MSIDKIAKGDALTQSKDLVTENIEKLKELFPEIVTEGKIDFNVLQDVLGEDVEEGDEYYRFTWAGKAQARREAHKPSTGTLRPAKDESVDWDTTKNIYIEGDNLEVLKLMQKSYSGKVKMIYIDPPYNTGKDFVYKDNYKDNLKNYQQVTGQIDDDGNRLTTNSESEGRYHSNWLNMMYPRLRLARNLLKDDGVIFMSIDDNEVENLVKLGNEIFGEDNLICIYPRITKKAGKSSDDIAKNNDYIIVFRKTKLSKLNSSSHSDEGFKHEDEFVEIRGKYKLNQTLDYGSIQYSPSLDYEIEIEGKILRPGGSTKEEMTARRARNPKTDFCWRWSKDLYNFGLKEGFVVLKTSKNGNRIYTKTYEKATISKDNGSYVVIQSNRTISSSTLDLLENKYSNDNSRKDLAKLFESKVFEYSKPQELLNKLIYLGSNDNDIVLDFFSGSATTADSLFNINLTQNTSRRFIMIQLQEETESNSAAFKEGFLSITEIGKERIRRVAEKIAKENPDKTKSLDLGFKVFKLDSSNIKGWNGERENLQQSLEDSVTNIKHDRSENDVLYEILLKYGLDLTLPIEEKKIEGLTVFNVGFGALFICLANKITSKVAESIGKWKEELNPEVCRVVFKDNGFTDVEKTNSVQTLKRFGITEIKSI